MSQLQKYYGLANMMIPEEGPRAVPANLEFDASGVIDIDGLLVSTNGVIGFVQGAFVDNSANALPFSIRCGVTNQVVIWPPNSQGYLPLLIPNPPNMVATLEGATGGEKVNIYFYNVPMQAAVWSTLANGGGGGGGDVTPTAVTFADYSIAMAGGDEQLLAAGDAARYFALQNPTGNGPVTVNLAGGDADASGIVIEGGGSLTIETGVGNAINISGTAAETIIAFGGS